MQTKGISLAGLLPGQSMGLPMGAQVDSGLQNLKHNVEGIRLDGKQDPLTEKKKIDKAAVDFESMLLHQMINSMWATVPKEGGVLSQSSDDETYRDMFNQALAQNIAEGQGIGIKAVIQKELIHQQFKKSAED